MACAAAEGHDSILQYLLSQGQSPNGSCKVIDTDSCTTICTCLQCYCILSYHVSYLCMMWSGCLVHVLTKFGMLFKINVVY